MQQQQQQQHSCPEDQQGRLGRGAPGDRRASESSLTGPSSPTAAADPVPRVRTTTSDEINKLLRQVGDMHASRGRDGGGPGRKNGAMGLRET